MQKISDSTSTANAAGEFTEGNPAAGADATIIKADWLNSIQRELINLVIGAGIAVNKNDDSQVLKAIHAIQVAAVTWAKLSGKPTTISGFGITDAFTKTETGSAIQTAISALVASSPAALDTLKELADALGNDPNFATTITNALADKASKATTLAGYNITDGLIVGRTSRQRPSLSAPNPGGYSSGGGAIEIREAQENYGVSRDFSYAPRIVFHWGGVLASDLAMDVSGALRWSGEVVWTASNFDPTLKADKATTLTGYGITPATALEVAAGSNNSKPVTAAGLQGLDPWAAQPIGAMISLRDDLMPGVTLPSKTSWYRYIKLSASDAYNAGVLVSESISGSGPLLAATAVISFPGSPLNGKTVQLINTDRRVLRAGLSGTVEQDALMGHGHMERVGPSGVAATTWDTASSYATGLSAAGAYSQRSATAPNTNSVSIGGPITDAATGAVRTDSETRVKSIGVTVYMRIA